MLSVLQMKRACRNQGIKVHGNKMELAQRLNLDEAALVVLFVLHQSSNNSPPRSEFQFCELATRQIRLGDAPSGTRYQQTRQGRRK